MCKASVVVVVVVAVAAAAAADVVVVVVAIVIFRFNLFFSWRCGPTRAMASSVTRFLDHTKRRTTVGRTPLDE